MGKKVIFVPLHAVVFVASGALCGFALWNPRTTQSMARPPRALPASQWRSIPICSVKAQAVPALVVGIQVEDEHAYRVGTKQVCAPNVSLGQRSIGSMVAAAWQEQGAPRDFDFSFAQELIDALDPDDRLKILRQTIAGIHFEVFTNSDAVAARVGKQIWLNVTPDIADRDKIHKGLPINATNAVTRTLHEAEHERLQIYVESPFIFKDDNLQLLRFSDYVVQRREHAIESEALARFKDIQATITAARLMYGDQAAQALAKDDVFLMLAPDRILSRDAILLYARKEIGDEDLFQHIYLGVNTEAQRVGTSTASGLADDKINGEQLYERAQSVHSFLASKLNSSTLKAMYRRSSSEQTNLLVQETVSYLQEQYPEKSGSAVELEEELENLFEAMFTAFEGEGRVDAR